jgi:hypothetical protein
MEFLSTREQAYAIWILLGLISAFLFKGLRKDFYPILSALVSKSFLKLYVIFLAYNAVGIYLLSLIDAWELSMLKDTVIWLVFAGLPLVYQVARAKKIKTYFLDLLKSLLTFAVVLEFLMGLHTFSLLTELLLAFVMLFLTFTIAFAQARSRYERVANLLQWLVLFITCGIVLSEMSYLFSNVSTYQSEALFLEFLLPAKLAFMIIPFLYGVFIYLRFEETFSVIKSPRFSKSIVRYCVVLLPYYFLNDPEGLLRWRWSVNKVIPQSLKELVVSMQQIKELIQEETDPPEVDPSLGWSPYLAKEFLMKMELQVGNYVNHYDQQWGASSNSKHLEDSDWLANSIDYFLNGNRYVVTQLKLRLNVFKLEKVRHSHTVFLAHASLLFSKISNDELPVTVLIAIMEGVEEEVVLDVWRLKVEKSEYLNVYRGYSLYFVIEHLTHVD